MKTEQTKSHMKWNMTMIAGVVVAVIGVAILVYSAYRLAFAPTVLSHVPHGGFNQSGFNQSGYNSTAAQRFRESGVYGGSSLLGGLSGVIIGLLTLALGLVTYKYGELKAALSRR